MARENLSDIRQSAFEFSFQPRLIERADHIRTLKLLQFSNWGDYPQLDAMSKGLA